MDNTQRITLDVLDNQTYEQIYIKQYNKGFLIEFEITRDGLPFDFSNAVAVFEMKKPDKTIYVDYCNISDNILSIEINSQMTAADGRAKFQITLYDLDSYDYDTKTGDVIITTVTGVMKIDKSTVQEGDVKSSDAFNIISHVITVTEVLVSEAREYASNAKYYSEQAGELITIIRDEVDETLKTALVTKADLDNSGQVKLEQIPKVALDKLVKVENDTARFALTTDDVQTGDTVLVLESDDDGAEKMYLVTDDTQLNNENGYTMYTASVTWDTIVGKPTEIGYLSGVTSAIQTQLDAKQPKLSGSISTITNANLTASRVLITNSAGYIATSSSIDTDELGYLDGVTSNIQTQLDGKASKTGWTASRVMCSNSSGNLTPCNTTTTEIGYLSGVTSKIQTQLDAKAPTSHASTATTYGVGTTSNYGHCMTVNNLTTSSHANGKALSAYQGKVLNDKIIKLNNAVNTSIATGAKAIMSYTDSSYYDIDFIMSFTDSNNAVMSGDKGVYAWGISSFSDERLKTNIKDSQVNALEKINQVQLKEFDFIDEKYGTHKDIGYIAQELKEVFPETVVLLPQDKEKTGYDSLYQVEDKHIIPYLVKSIQELSAKVDDLEVKIDELKNVTIN